MKLLAVLGSPRKKGNSSLLLDQYLKGIREANRDADIAKVYLQEKNIRHCTACDVCHTITPGRCAIKDDMQELYGLFAEAAMVVYATPVYWWGVSAQLKAFLDRTNAFDVPDGTYFAGKKAALLMTYGLGLPNKGPELVAASFGEICRYTGMDLIDVYGICANKAEPAAENAKALREVYELGLRIAL
ncbi:MAG TPA: flavodoxin family protein [Selenomonadales bacterium]|nr:flavodoxin family protein [Selenomonadales bacterium]